MRVLTVAREYGSGGAPIARSELAGQYDERVHSWVHRVSRNGLWHGAFDEVAAVAEGEILDSETVAERARTLIEAAYKKGSCVIVGRGGQCVLQDHADAFHVFIYAPWRDRLARIRRREPRAADVDELIDATDRQRAEHIRLHFDCDWANPHLYHMMISSRAGENEVVQILPGILKRN